jgi:hypothetical protein
MTSPPALACLHICTEKEKRLRAESSSTAQNKLKQLWWAGRQTAKEGRREKMGQQEERGVGGR